MSLLQYNFHFNFKLFVDTGHANYGFVDVKYLQDVFFSIEIGLQWQAWLWVKGGGGGGEGGAKFLEKGMIVKG